MPNLNLKSVEKVYRAYIPREGLKWFKSFLKETPGIDVWLFIRQDHDQMNCTNNEYANQTINYSVVKYKYYSEFKVLSGEAVESQMNNFEKYSIKLAVMIEDVKKHLSQRKYGKRSSVLSPIKSILGKYVGFNDVFIILKNTVKPCRNGQL